MVHLRKVRKTLKILSHNRKLNMNWRAVQENCKFQNKYKNFKIIRQNPTPLFFDLFFITVPARTALFIFLAFQEEHSDVLYIVFSRFVFNLLSPTFKYSPNSMFFKIPILDQKYPYLTRHQFPSHSFIIITSIFTGKTEPLYLIPYFGSKKCAIRNK